MVLAGFLKKDLDRKLNERSAKRLRKRLDKARKEGRVEGRVEGRGPRGGPGRAACHVEGRVEGRGLAWRAEGRVRATQAAASTEWLARMQEAQRKGDPFDEAPPWEANGASES